MPVAKNGHTILLGEDDFEVRQYLETALRCQGYAVVSGQDGEEVLERFSRLGSSVSAIVLDAIMPNKDGFEALRELRQLNRDLPIIMISGASSPLDVVKAMKYGASDFIAKPINPEDLRKALSAAIGAPAVPATVPELAVAPRSNSQVFTSLSPGMRELQDLLGPVGWSEAPVLIQGETGAGKEVFARQLHACSPRAKKSLLKLNCAALPSELVESELFGYERGAFTGAYQKKLGMFELADGGTLLLDEIGDMDFKLQAKLLQVLQDQEFQRIGGKDTVKVDVRVIAATHCDLEKAIVENCFREDLYYRLNVVTLRVPPLRERTEDLAALAEFFVRKHSAIGAPIFQIPPTLHELFLQYHWPGNVRELENMIRKLLVLRDARLVERDLRAKLAKRPLRDTEPMAVETLAELPPASVPETAVMANGTRVVAINDGARPPFATGHSNGASESSPPVLVQVAHAKREAERSAILAALKSTNWNRRQAAVRLQIDYKALLYKIKVLAITKEKAVWSPALGSGTRTATAESS